MQNYDSSNPYTNFMQWQQSAWQQWLQATQAATPGGYNSAAPPYFNPFNSNSFSTANPFTAASGGLFPWQLQSSLFDSWQQQWGKLSSSVAEFTRQFDNTDGSVDAWMPHFEEMFDNLREAFTQLNSNNNKRFEELTACYKVMSSGVMGNPAFMSGMPNIGPMRMQHQATRRHMERITRLADCSKEYVEYIGQIPLRALELLRQKLLQLAQEDKSISSIRGLYDVWVHCMDSASREVVFTTEYPVLYAAVTNAMLQVFADVKENTDSYNRYSGQPTSSSSNTMARRQHRHERIMRLEVMPQLSQMQSGLRDMRQRLETLAELAESLQGMEKLQSELAKTKKKLTSQQSLLRKLETRIDKIAATDGDQRQLEDDK